MGCCMSSSGASKSQQDQVQRRRAAIDSRAPPPSAEEETVKEVLSETPIPFFSESELHHSTKNPKSRQPVSDGDGVTESVEFRPKAEISEDVSELCSLSESVSAATSLTDEYGVQNHFQRPSNRSPAKVRSFRNCSGAVDLGTRRDNVRRSDQSPGRRNAGSARIVQSREPSRPRRDPGESSARRSRSPAMSRIENAGTGGASRQGLTRSPSMRRTNPSPGRVRCRDPNGHDGVGNSKRTNGDESLENPLVSLECFIFL